MFANTDEFNQNIGQWNIITPHNLDQTQGPNYVFSKMFKNAKNSTKIYLVEIYITQ